jgi:hypothetical protein
VKLVKRQTQPLRQSLIGLLIAVGMSLFGARVAAGDPVIVPAFPCTEFFGGHVTVPAGSEVVVANRWEAKNPGLVRNYLSAQTTTLDVDGTVSHISDGYGPIIAIPGGYRTSLLHDTGVTLAAGQSMTFNLVIALSHRLHDGFTLVNTDSHEFLFFGPGVIFEFPCTVTGE